MRAVTIRGGIACKGMIFDLERRFHDVPVMVLGDVMLDEYISGSVSRISPEAPVPIVDVRAREFFLGGAANVAANAVALGARVALLGLASQDEAGRQLSSLLARTGIQNCLTDSGDRGTICKTRIVAGRQQIVRIDHERLDPISEGLIEMVFSSVSTLNAAMKVLILSDYAKGLLTKSLCRDVIQQARQLGIPVIVDPKGDDFQKYSGCAVITPNLAEAGRTARTEVDSEAGVNRAGATLAELLPGTAILITRGADGMTLFRAGDPPLTVPTVARKVYDVVGAGDTVVATLAVALGAGMDIAEAMQIANIAAGVVVDKPGTATATIAEILSHGK